jgi:WD40 repeat protein
MAVGVDAHGRRAVTGAIDGTVRVWDLGSYQEIRTLAMHRKAVLAVVLSLDGRRVLSAGLDGKLKAWNLNRRAKPETLIRVTPSPQRSKRRVSAVAVTPDAQRAVSARDDGTLRSWDLRSGREIATTVKYGRLWPHSALAVTPDGSRALFTTDGGSMYVWSLESETAQELLNSDDPDWAVTSDLRRALSCNWLDGSVKLWDLTTGDAAVVGQHELAMAVAVTPDGRTAISGSREVKVWDLDGRQEMATTPPGHHDMILALAISRDGSRAVSGSNDRTVVVWDLERHQPLATATFGGRILDVAASADATTVLVRDGLDTLTCLRLE